MSSFNTLIGPPLVQNQNNTTDSNHKLSNLPLQSTSNGYIKSAYNLANQKVVVQPIFSSHNSNNNLDKIQSKHVIPAHFEPYIPNSLEKIQFSPKQESNYYNYPALPYMNNDFDQSTRDYGLNEKSRVFQASVIDSYSNVIHKNDSAFISNPKEYISVTNDIEDIKARAKIQKSKIEKSLCENMVPPENTLIILDYDDTLLPTNWVAVQHKIGLGDQVPILLQNHLAELSSLAIKTINFCLKSGRLIVVTNASIEWVRRSGEKFIPAVWRHLNLLKIEIVSARDRWQNTGLVQRLWKLKIFEEAVLQTFSKKTRLSKDCCVISIGDGEGEREACLEMWRQAGFNDWVFKSLKLLPQPSCNQLISEHLLIQQAFKDILLVSQSLDMAILDYKQSQHQNIESCSDKIKENELEHAKFYSKSVITSNNLFNNSSGIKTSGKSEPQGAKVTNSKSKYLGTDLFVDAISEQLKQIKNNESDKIDG